MDSSHSRNVLGVDNTAAGVKRSAPGSLLPPFEPSSSPPCFKCHSSHTSESKNRYPTPVRSSSLGILSTPPPQLSCKPANTLQNHITNHLAFSRLSSTPLSALLSNLPSSLAQLVNKELLIDVLNNLHCVGEIKRSGKDAAGKPLESEYCYTPDRDTDSGRRDAVVQGMGRVGLRACRRTHKV
ncbi:unnamed protein product [Tuber melanosporum]|uniref:(Perigord truffle) hypothetical protein n=1 Tax=Tuber melanosporum (strain Mel28) TaxID=656061 RepID=D5GA15_TUBMM|nr:uncharacterized protein GSTUM_00003518001 [Tuber melanosporum]CAZ81358.1 unnamed protein product [Tuber melanosporum]